MKGGAPLDMSEIERVSSLFDVKNIGGAITEDLVGGADITNGPMGEVASLGDIQKLTIERQQMGGGRSRKQKRRRGNRKTRGNRKPRFRLNLRASIRWHR